MNGIYTERIERSLFQNYLFVLTFFLLLTYFLWLFPISNGYENLCTTIHMVTVNTIFEPKTKQQKKKGFFFNLTLCSNSHVSLVSMEIRLSCIVCVTWSILYIIDRRRKKSLLKSFYSGFKTFFFFCLIYCHWKRVFSFKAIWIGPDNDWHFFWKEPFFPGILQQIAVTMIERYPTHWIMRTLSKIDPNRIYLRDAYKFIKREKVSHKYGFL